MDSSSDAKTVSEMDLVMTGNIYCPFDRYLMQHELHPCGMIARAGNFSMGHPEIPAFCEYGVEATRFNNLRPNLAVASQCSMSSWNPRL